MKHLKLFEQFRLFEDNTNYFEVKDGCNVVYHGGKFMENDPKWLIQNQGGIYCTKSLSGAQAWGWVGGVIAKQRWQNLSNSISNRVYEFTIVPGSKMKNMHAGGLDSSSMGGLKDERMEYYKDGVIGIANQQIMDRPTNSISAESCLDSEIILFDVDKSVSCRVIPFIEVLEHYKNFNLGNRYEAMMDWYKKVRKIVWFGYKNNLLVVDGEHIFDKQTIYQNDWKQVAEFYKNYGRIYEGYLDDLTNSKKYLEDAIGSKNSDPFYTGPEERAIQKKERVVSEEIDVDKVDAIIEKLANMFIVNYGFGIQNMTSLDEILAISKLKKS
jgi:hypothetical protein